MTKHMENQDSRSIRFTEGIVLALVSASAYLFAYFYEIGYASFLHIPQSFITVSLTNILVFGAVALTAFLWLFPFLNLIVMTFTAWKPYPGLAPSTRLVMLAALYQVVIIYAYGVTNWKYWLPGMVVMDVLLGLFFYGIPIVQYLNNRRLNRHKSFGALVEESENADRKTTSFADLITKRLGPESGQFILFLIIGTGLAQGASYGQALNQSEYLVTNTSPELVVVRIYGDNIICAPLDRATNEVQSTFTIRKVADDPKLTLTVETLGPLHRKSP
jgi:hypothetical protein